MKPNQKAVASFFGLSVIAALPVLLLRLAILFFGVDPDTGFFKADAAVYPAAMNIYIGVCLLTLFIAAIVYEKKIPRALAAKEAAKEAAEEAAEETAPEDGEPAEKKEEPPAFSMPYSGILTDTPEENGGSASLSEAAKTVSGRGGAFSAFTGLFAGCLFIVSSVFALFSDNGTLYTVVGIFGLLSAAFFFTATFSSGSGNKKPILTMSYAPMIWCTVRAIAEYRGNMGYINRTMLFGNVLFVTALTLFFVFQTQTILAYEPFNRPYYFIFSGFAVCFLGIAVTFPQFIYMIIEGTDSYFALSIVLNDIAAGIYCAVKSYYLSGKKAKLLYGK